MSQSNRRIITHTLSTTGTVLLILASSLVFAGKPTGGAPIVYTITELHANSDGRASAVNTADANGVLSIVGRTATAAGDKNAALWNTTAAGSLLGLTNLGAVPFTNPGAVAVNDDDLVVLTRPARAVIPGLGQVSLPLDGTLPVGSEAYGINSLGDIVGSIYDNDAGHDAGALWNIDAQGNVSGPVSLGEFVPQDINNSGMMAGNLAGFAAVAEFDANGLLQVHSLGGLVGTDSSSQAWAINNCGEVVGESTSATGRQAYYWNSLTGMIALGTLGGKQSEAFDINDQGQVVGSAQLKNGNSAAFLWQNGKVLNLNTLSGVSGSRRLISANGINNSGHIVGEMRIELPTLNFQGFLLTPKP